MASVLHCPSGGSPETEAGAKMRTFVLITFLAFSVSPIRAAEIANKNSPSTPVAQELQEMLFAPPNARPSVRFVVGNDLWQPRQQFKAGRDWLALMCNAKGCSLESAALSVEQEFWQGHYDDKPTLGQRLKFKVDGGSGSELVAWFNTVPALRWLRPGAVATYNSPQRQLRRLAGRGTLEAVIDLPSGDSILVVPLLATKAFLNKLQPEQTHDWPLVVLQLRAQNKRQLLQGTLGTCSGTFDPRHYLLWAGDLDRDGRPDFLISFIDADGPVHLYLSSAAKPNQLVGLAGVYYSPPFGGECDGPGGFMQFEGDGADGG